MSSCFFLFVCAFYMQRKGPSVCDAKKIDALRPCPPPMKNTEIAGKAGSKRDGASQARRLYGSSSPGEQKNICNSDVNNRDVSHYCCHDQEQKF